MSKLETSARPLLERLWQPSHAFGRTAVSVDEASVLATWATKTAWIRERLSDPVVTPTPGLRRYLMDHQLPPQFTRVWIARHQGRSNFGVYVGQIETSHEDDSWDSERRRHVLVCAMTFRGLSVLVRTDDGWGVPEMTLRPRQWRQFWPVPETIQWPPPVPVSDGDVQIAAMQYSWLRNPDVPTFNRDRDGIQEFTRN